MLVHVGLNLVVEIFHDALERFGERFVGDSGAPSSCWTRSRSLWTSTRTMPSSGSTPHTRNPVPPDLHAYRP
jgi:hypothetical protein